MDVERYWQLFEEMGEDKVVKAVSGKHFLAEKEQAAEIWLRRKAEHRASAAEQESLKLVAEANVLAREANAISQKSDKKARTANFIAAAALIVALIALFFKR
jgi:ferric-dicitrate binding protein FerR (iron transport regulator)